MLYAIRNVRRRSADTEKERVVSSYRVTPQHPDLGDELSDVDTLAFIHHRTSIFNLGDYLSSPRHYFRFKLAKDARPTAVIGGGVYGKYERLVAGVGNFAIGERVRIGWGVGQSINREGRSGSSKMARFAEMLDITATRDLSYATDQAPFCPCSSAMNAIVDIAPGSKTGIVLNFDPRASGENPLQMLATFKDCIWGNNTTTERDFRALFAQTDRVVTNSYHTAFWGLLSGRAVGMVGFSTKYDNIRSMFDLNNDYQRYTKGDGPGLKAAIDTVLQADKFVRLSDPGAYKQKFRQLNISYGNRLVEDGYFQSIEPIADDDVALNRRTTEVLAEYVLEEF